MQHGIKVLSLRGKTAKIHKTAYIHPTVIIIGDVFIDKNCFIGPNVVLRADNGYIKIMENSSIQDNCVVHSSHGENVTLHPYSRIGHNVVLHGCEIQSWAVIGIGSTIMDKAVVGSYSIVGGMSFVKKNDIIPPKKLVVGIPAIVKRELNEKELEASKKVTFEYVNLPQEYFSHSYLSEPLYFDDETYVVEKNIKFNSDVKND